MVVRLIAIVVLAFGLSFHAASEVRAQPSESAVETSEAEAARLHEQGNRLFDARRFSDAARVLRRSLELRPSPAVAFNLAQSLRSTGRLLDSIELYDGLLDGRYGRLPRRRRRQVRAQRDEVQGDVGTLHLRVDGPERAEVRIDGVRVGRIASGAALEQAIDPGAHTITISAPTYVMAEHNVVVAPGGESEIVVRLELSPRVAMGRLVVVAPDAADLLIVEGVGRARGRLEATAAPGIYEVVLEGPSGFRTVSTEVTGGETRTLLLEALLDEFPVLEIVLVGAATLAVGAGVAIGLALTLEVEQPVEGAEPWGVLVSLMERSAL